VKRIRSGAGRSRQQPRIGAPDPALTPNAGLAAITELCDQLGVIGALDAAVGPIKQRDRGFGAGELLAGIAAAQLAGELRLTPGSTLLDLACGRGAYGLLIAQKAGTLLIGADFSVQALTEAREQAARMGVSDASFRVRDRPSWLAREHALWEETVTLAPGDDPALRSLHAEGVKSLQWTDLLRRVLAVATNPQ